MTVDGDTDLEARVRQLESVEEIRQLVARYALALDSRNVEALAALFVADVETHGGGRGRAALAEWFNGPVLRQGYSTTFHLIGNHIIDFVDDDHATGALYCRPEHEAGDLWVIMPVVYEDRYERQDGHWYFRSRRPHAFYAADVTESPLEIDEPVPLPRQPVHDPPDAAGAVGVVAALLGRGRWLTATGRWPPASTGSSRTAPSASSPGATPTPSTAGTSTR